MPTTTMPTPSGPMHRRAPTIVVVHARDGRHIRVRSPAGAIRSIRGLTELVDFLLGQPECEVGVKNAIIALGTALHCAQNGSHGVAAAFDDAVSALRGCKASPTLLRLERLIERRPMVLTQREAAGRIMAEARRIARECSLPRVHESETLARSASTRA